MMGAVAGVMMASAAVVLVVGFVGPSGGHLPGLPDLQPGQQEVAKVPQPTPSPDGPPSPRRGGNAPAPAPPETPSTSDNRGNGNGNGANPSNRPDHPRPTKSK